VKPSNACDAASDGVERGDEAFDGTLMAKPFWRYDLRTTDTESARAFYTEAVGLDLTDVGSTIDPVSHRRVRPYGERAWSPPMSGAERLVWGLCVAIAAAACSAEPPGATEPRVSPPSVPIAPEPAAAAGPAASESSTDATPEIAASSEPAVPEPAPAEVAPADEAWDAAPVVTTSADGTCTVRRLDRWLLVLCNDVRVPMPRSIVSSGEDPEMVMLGVRVANRFHLRPGELLDVDLLGDEGAPKKHFFAAWPSDEPQPLHIAVGSTPFKPPLPTATRLPEMSSTAAPRPAPADWVKATVIRAPASPPRCSLLSLAGWVRVTCAAPSADAGLIMVTSAADLGVEGTDYFVDSNVFQHTATLELRPRPGTPHAAFFAWGNAVGMPVEFLSPADVRTSTRYFAIEWEKNQPKVLWR
jgi:hypothetical protein